ncbi:hypothetical protein BV25DRAFT_1256004 [Artomyces pyxidatus]|uniref:Uncharacterized protein n=1 Tax=Artomyces pyxidatus TaxID=48021 RepID=A0ACB8TET6_9AGAM|nr:hypothetical protein BV25DRAFT_1256004 [Artomyces pyxidatus]
MLGMDVDGQSSVSAIVLILGVFQLSLWPLSRVGSGCLSEERRKRARPARPDTVADESDEQCDAQSSQILAKILPPWCSPTHLSWARALPELTS